MKDILDLIARIFIATIFFYEAYDSIAFFQLTKEKMSHYGINFQQDLLLYGAIFALVLGAILVLIGYRSKLGSILLLFYLVPVTFIVYSFWNDPIDVRRVNSISFMKNIAIIGALLMIIVNGSGKYSIKRLFATTKVSKGWGI